MEFLTNIIEFLPTILLWSLAVVGFLLSAAKGYSAIAKLTKTKRDDEIAAVIEKFLGKAEDLLKGTQPKADEPPKSEEPQA